MLWTKQKVLLPKWKDVVFREQANFCCLNLQNVVFVFKLCKSTFRFTNTPKTSFIFLFGKKFVPFQGRIWKEKKHLKGFHLFFDVVFIEGLLQKFEVYIKNNCTLSTLFIRPLEHFLPSFWSYLNFFQFFFETGLDGKVLPSQLWQQRASVSMKKFYFSVFFLNSNHF